MSNRSRSCLADAVPSGNLARVIAGGGATGGDTTYAIYANLGFWNGKRKKGGATGLQIDAPLSLVPRFNHLAQALAHPGNNLPPITSFRQLRDMAATKDQKRFEAYFDQKLYDHEILRAGIKRKWSEMVTVSENARNGIAVPEAWMNDKKEPVWKMVGEVRPRPKKNQPRLH